MPEQPAYVFVVIKILKWYEHSLTAFLLLIIKPLIFSSSLDIIWGSSNILFTFNQVNSEIPGLYFFANYFSFVTKYIQKIHGKVI